MTTQSGEWWYAEGAEQRGPVSLAELSALIAEGKIVGETLVWHAGMTGWTPAGRVPELGIGSRSPHGAEEPPRPTPPGAADTEADSQDSGGRPTTPSYARTADRSTSVPNNMVLAILATVFCCLPLGIVAIVKAAQVRAVVESGDLARARSVADEAKKWALWAIGLGLLGQILYFTIIGGSAFLSLLGGGGDF